jgi:hypothetical protein
LEDFDCVGGCMGVGQPLECDSVTIKLQSAC